MTQQLLQINFKLATSREEFEPAVEAIAIHFANFPGLVWKTWIMNEPAQEAGGIYLFESEEALGNYLSSDLIRGLDGSPAITNISIKQFAILEKPSVITNAPVGTINAN